MRLKTCRFQLNFKYRNTEFLLLASAKKLKSSSIHIENTEQSSYLLSDMDIFPQIVNITLLVHVHLVKARIYHLLPTQLKGKD